MLRPASRLICAYAVFAALHASAATFTVINTNDVGAGSLREAISNANATATADIIAFNIPGTNEHDIYLFTALPIITNVVTVDGFTQTGSKSNTLAVGGNNSVLKINIQPSAQGLGGFHVKTNSCVFRGLSMRRYQVAAIYLQDCSSNVVEGCLFGTEPTGLLDWNNNYMGVRIGNSSFNRVGGTNAYQYNMFAFGNGAGVGVFSGTNNAILGNPIFAIGGQGIDLDFNNRTVNDSDDSDTGANNRQNFPVITNATLTGSGVLVRGTFTTVPNGAFRLEFFSGPTAFRSDFAYANKFIGWTNLTTDGSGFANFSATLPVAVPDGYFISATATDTNGNTSEISDPKQIPTSQPYLVKALGTINHGYNQGNDVNNHGDAVGFGHADPLGTNTHAWLYTNGVTVSIGTLAGGEYYASAQGINDSRVVVGFSSTPGNVSVHAFRWSNGVMSDLGGLPGGGTNHYAWDINNAGQIVGEADTSTGPAGNTHAVLWQSNTIVDLGVLPGDVGSEAWAINENGDVFGASWADIGLGSRGPYHPFIWHNGVMTNVTGIAYGLSAIPARMNTRGDIAYSVHGPDGALHGYLRSGGVDQDFGLFGILDGRANGVNGSGWAVGHVSTPLTPIEAAGTRAVVYRDGIIHDLNTLLLNSPGSILRTAQAINDDGVILANNVGQVLLNNIVFASVNEPSATNAFLLFPVSLRIEANPVRLSWLTELTGFSLQSTTNLALPASWATVPGSPTAINGRNYFTNNLPGTYRFFRLYKP